MSRRLSRPPRDYLNFADRGSRALFRRGIDALAGPPFSAPRPHDELVADVAATRPLLERLLVDNLVGFWFPHCIEPTGGYRFERDRAGAFVPPRAHRTIAVARTTWFFAALARSPWGLDAHRDAALHGMRTLREVLWDRECGGFFYETDREGIPVTPEKDTYSHAFALSAVCEVAEATRDPDVARFADDVHSVMETHLRDTAFGGYREIAGRAWEVLDDRVPRVVHADPRLRTLNCLVHVSEGMTAYTRLAATPLARVRLQQLTRLLADTTVDDRFGVGIDTHAPDWTPRYDAVWPRIAVSYGHEAERVAGIGRAADVLDLRIGPVHERLSWITANQLRWGWDRLRGGVFQSGALGGPAWDPSKLWWVQAESMITYLDVYSRTGMARAGEAYLATLQWIDRHQVDWEHGEWFARIDRFGRPGAAKTSAWKTPFHIGRSLLLALERVDQLSASVSHPTPPD